MNKLATIFMIPGGPAWCKDHGIGPNVLRYLVERWNLTLGNTGIDPQDISRDTDRYLEAKWIADMFGYLPSRKNWWMTHHELESLGYLENGNWYFYDCGDGAFKNPPRLGMDEPGSRGPVEWRYWCYAQAVRENEIVHDLFPGLKTVATHPFPTAFGSKVYNAGIPHQRIDSDVWAWRLSHLIEAYDTHGPDWRKTWDIPEDKEIWAYLITEDLVKNAFAFAPDVGKSVREVGATALLINTDLSPLINEDATDPRELLSKNGTDLLNGMVRA